MLITDISIAEMISKLYSLCSIHIDELKIERDELEDILAHKSVQGFVSRLEKFIDENYKFIICHFKNYYLK